MISLVKTANTPNAGDAANVELVAAEIGQVSRDLDGLYLETVERVVEKTRT